MSYLATLPPAMRFRPSWGAIGYGASDDLATLLAACPKANKHQNKIAKYRLKRSHASWKTTIDMYTRWITRQRERRDLELLKCKQKGVEIPDDLLWLDENGNGNGYDNGNGNGNGGGTMGMGAFTQDVPKLVYSLVALSAFVGGAIFLTRKWEERQA